MRQRSGSVSRHGGQWQARVRYTDPDGTRHELKRLASTKYGAKDLLPAMLQEADRLVGHILTYGDLIAHYRAVYIIPAVYAQGQKVRGLRSLKSVEGHLSNLKAIIPSDKSLATFTPEYLRIVRAELSTTKHNGRERSVANVNRILSTLRRMFSIAHREGWMARNPFQSIESLIVLSAERPRERVMTQAEEAAILKACEVPDVNGDDVAYTRRHLAFKVLLLVETGMREGEANALKWGDVDLKAGSIRVLAANTKTLREREVPISARLKKALSKRKGEPDADVLEEKETKRAWATACRIAGVKGLQLRDLRATFGTRLIEMGMPIAEVGKILGHANIQTTFRHYARANRSITDRARGFLDAFRSKGKR